MTRIDMTTREWHELIRPVLPHAGTDREFPEYCSVRLEAGESAVYAVARDLYTLAAERHPLPGSEHGMHVAQPVHLAATELKASLKLFAYSKDEDPPLRITIDHAPVPVSVAGLPRSINHLAVTVQPAGDGTRLVMHDQRDPARDALAGWRKAIWTAMTRKAGRALEGLDLLGVQLARWQAAAGSGERLTLYTGPEPGDPLLVTVGKHFAGIAAVQQYIDSPGRTRDELPWQRELEPHLFTDTEGTADQ